MYVNAHFTNIKDIIIKELQSAQTEILIASAWFTNQNIFDILLEKLPKVSIKLIILNDDINNRPDGLNFQQFIDKGGQFYYGLKENPMHNKYCIIDTNTVITGSYNYTYFAEAINEENIVIIKNNEEIVKDYKDNFNKLIADKEQVKSIEQYLKQNPYTTNIFSSYTDISIQKLENADSFEIKNVIYQHGQNCHIENIQVKNGNIAITLKTKLKQGQVIHGSDIKLAWFIRDIKYRNEGIRCTHYKITDIQVNNETKLLELVGGKLCQFLRKDVEWDVSIDKQKIILIGISAPKEFEMSCKIHFRARDLIHTTIDLIEGFRTDEDKSRLHVFGINMKTNRTPLL